MSIAVPNRIQTLDGGLRRADWLDGIEEIWPEFEGAAERHRELSEAYRTAQAERRDLEAEFEREDRERLAAIEAGEEPDDRTPEADRIEERRELDEQVDVARRHLVRAVEEVIAEVKERRDDMQSTIDAANVAADDLRREAQTLIAKAGRLAATTNGARHWLDRTTKGHNYVTFPALIPQVEDAALVRDHATSVLIHPNMLGRMNT